MQRSARGRLLSGACRACIQYTKGVKKVLSGYSGGDRSTAQYEKVGTGRTGHAESVEIVFDPKEISYGEILAIYFSVAHDPTQLDRQGPDVGTQYRSAIFLRRRVAAAHRARLHLAAGERRVLSRGPS